MPLKATVILGARGGSEPSDTKFEWSKSRDVISVPGHKCLLLLGLASTEIVMHLALEVIGVLAIATFVVLVICIVYLRVSSR